MNIYYILKRINLAHLGLVIFILLIPSSFAYKIKEHSHYNYIKAQQKAERLNKDLNSVRANIVSKHINNQQGLVLLSALTVSHLNAILLDDVNVYELTHDAYKQMITSNLRIFNLEKKTDKIHNDLLANNKQLISVNKNLKQNVNTLSKKLNRTNRKLDLANARLFSLEKKLNLTNKYLAQIARNTYLPPAG